MRKEDLVVLCYANNTCCTNVVDLNEEQQKLEVNIDKGIWMLKGETGSFWIGKAMKSYNKGCIPENAVIGVYDRMNTEHLDSMVHHSHYAVRQPSYEDD